MWKQNIETPITFTRVREITWEQETDTLEVALNGFFFFFFKGAGGRRSDFNSRILCGHWNQMMIVFIPNHLLSVNSEMSNTFWASLEQNSN